MLEVKVLTKSSYQFAALNILNKDLMCEKWKWASVPSSLPGKKKMKAFNHNGN